MDSTLSKYPHFNSTYLVKVQFSLDLGVCMILIGNYLLSFIVKVAILLEFSSLERKDLFKKEGKYIFSSLSLNIIFVLLLL